MEGPTHSLLLMFLVIMAVPFITPHIKLPVIVTEILIGVLLGTLGLIENHKTLEFFASFGLVYLMFLAGLEVQVEIIKKHLSQTLIISLSSLLLPFTCGMALGTWIGINPMLLGTVFSTTSLGIVLPMMRSMKESDIFGQVLLGSVILIDMLSMFLLAFTLSLLDGSLTASFAYSAIAVLTLFLIPWICNKFAVREAMRRILRQEAYFEREVRMSFALIFLLGTATEFFGFHGIVGSFIAGLVIAEVTPESSQLEDKLKSFGYGFFIPLFFILVGSRVDLIGIFSNLQTLEILVAVIITAVGSKVIGVALTARARGFSWRESFAMGSFHSARLSLIIAASEIARKAGYIDNNMFSILVILAVITATFAPAIANALLQKDETT